MADEIKEELQRQTAEKIATVNQEMAWEEEKHCIALEKLRARFKDVVECERIVVRAFLTSHQVASFRAAKLSDDFYAAKAEIERKRASTLNKDDPSRQATQDASKGNGCSVITAPFSFRTGITLHQLQLPPSWKQWQEGWQQTAQME